MSLNIRLNNTSKVFVVGSEETDFYPTPEQLDALAAHHVCQLEAGSPVAHIQGGGTVIASGPLDIATTEEDPDLIEIRTTISKAVSNGTAVFLPTLEDYEKAMQEPGCPQCEAAKP